MRITGKKITAIVIAYVVIHIFGSCKSPNIIGTFTNKGTLDWAIFYYMQVKADGTFTSHYINGDCGMSTSGVWHLSKNKIVCESNVQNLDSFQLFIKYDSLYSQGKGITIVLENMNWRYHNWYCVANNDTVKIQNDTLLFTNKETPLIIYFYVTPLKVHELRELPYPTNSFAYCLPRQHSVKSETIGIKAPGQYLIGCDSLFGKEPLQYMLWTDRNFIINKAGLLDLNNGFPLIYDKTSIDGYIYLDKMMSNPKNEN